jgi:hypothetical protein
MITGNRGYRFHIPQYVQPAAPRHIDIEYKQADLRLSQPAQHLVPAAGFGKKRAPGSASARISFRPRRTTAWSSAIRMFMALSLGACGMHRHEQ